MITKKYYKEIAFILNKNRCKLDVTLLDDLCDFFIKDNPNFSKDKFVSAVFKNDN